MVIKILGTGCPNCQKLEANARQAVKELRLSTNVEKITDIGKIMGYGVMSLPALLIGDEVKFYGRVVNVNEIKEMLAE